MSAPSFDDLYDLAKAEMLLRRGDLFAAPGDVTDFILAAIAAAADKTIQYANEEMRKTFLDGATGDDLTALIDDHYNVQRQVATASEVTLTFSRITAAAGAGNIPAGTTVATEFDINGERVEFETDAILAWGGAETGDKTITATAVVSGRASNVDIGTITNIVDGLFDSSITVNNLAVAAGGNDEESDPQLRERARGYTGVLRRGTIAAIQYGALTIASVRVATAVEDDSGVLTLYVSDEDGGSTSQMVTEVAEELENWRCAGVPVNVVGGTVSLQDIAVTLTVITGTDIVALTADIETALTERLLRLPVGDGTSTSAGVLRREIIAATIICLSPGLIIGVDVTTPSADVVPAAGSVIRVGTITVS